MTAASPEQGDFTSPRTWTGSLDGTSREARELACLWLTEPEIGGPAAAAEYHRLLLDGVPPFAGAYLDRDGFVSWSDEPRVWWPAGWRPPDWVRAAATDHLGVSLLVLAELGGSAGPAARHLASWAPLATAALRSYAPQPPFDELSDRTDRVVMAALSASAAEPDQEVAGSAADGAEVAGSHTDGPEALSGGTALGSASEEWPEPPDSDPDDELGLNAVVSWLAVPRRAGWCLTVPDVGRIAGALELPASRTGGRRDALATLFHGAGRDGATWDLLRALDDEAARAQAHYGRLATEWPSWTPIGRAWAAQTAVTRGFLARLGAAAEGAQAP